MHNAINRTTTAVINGVAKGKVKILFPFNNTVIAVGSHPNAITDAHITYSIVVIPPNAWFITNALYAPHIDITMTETIPNKIYEPISFPTFTLVFFIKILQLIYI